MLPYIVPENGEKALGDRGVLIRRGDDLHIAAGFTNQPYPSAAELLSASFVKFGLEVLKVAKGFLDHLADRAAGITTAFGLHDFPVHAVIHVAATIVAYGSPDIFRDRIQIP